MSIVITALKKIYEEEGVDIYLDPYRYYSLAEDYISDRDSRFLEQLYYCARNNILETLYRVHTEPSSRSRERLFQKAKLLFLQNRKYSAEDASVFFQNYMDAFGWKIVEPKKEEAPAAAPQQKAAQRGPVVNAKETEKQEKQLSFEERFEQEWKDLQLEDESNTPAAKKNGHKPVKKKKKSKFMSLVKVGIVIGGILWILDVANTDRESIDISNQAQNSLSSYASETEDSTEVSLTEATVLSEEPQIDTSVYHPITVTYAYASSVIDQPGYDNSASVMFDGDRKTSWQEGVGGYGIGESAGAYFDQFHDVKYISFNLGNWSNHDLYDKNGVPDVLKLTLGDFSQEIQFPADRHDLENTQWVEFTEPIHTDSIELEIRDVLAGKYYEDTCIAEITIYGM